MVAALGSLASVAATSDPHSAARMVEPRKLGLCVGCHGRNGRATLAGLPHLSGQDAEYLLSQLKAYRSGQRINAQMQASVGSLNEQDMRELADWYAAQECAPGQE